MDLLLIALLLAALGVVVAVALGKVGGGMAPVPPDAVPALDKPVARADDLDRARFTLAVRGYRMDQVDTVLDEARDLLAAQDEEIARLRRLVPVAGDPAERHPVQPPAAADQAAADQAAAAEPAGPAPAGDPRP